MSSVFSEKCPSIKQTCEIINWLRNGGLTGCRDVDRITAEYYIECGIPLWREFAIRLPKWSIASNVVFPEQIIDRSAMIDKCGKLKYLRIHTSCKMLKHNETKLRNSRAKRITCYREDNTCYRSDIIPGLVREINTFEHFNLSDRLWI